MVHWSHPMLRHRFQVSPGYEMEALKKSDDLRKSGKKVEISLFDSIDETVKYAEEKNISEILTVGGKEEQ